MFAVSRCLGLEKYIANEHVPGAAKEGQPTEEIEGNGVKDRFSNG